MSWINQTLWICLGYAYFAKTENFFAKSTIDKDKF